MAASEVMIINPAKRRKARRKNPSAAQLRARARFAAAAHARSRTANPKRRRRRNPVAQSAAPYIANPRRRSRRRRSNPALRTYRAASRRRRNPIGLGGVSVAGIMNMAKEAAVMGAGAVAMDMGYSYVAKYLPANMQAGPGQVTLGSGVKIVLTAAIGKLLSKSTRGLSQKAALGSLVVQFRDIASGLLPAGTVAGLGYSVPGRVINQSARVGPNRVPGMGGYTGRGGVLLDGRGGQMGAYMTPGSGRVLLDGRSAREREGYPR